MMTTNRAILISIQPRHNENILNGIKTLEIRKKFPKDYVGWVYIYCTKDNKKHLYPVALLDKHNKVFKRGYKEDDIDNRTNYLNGKVVARFWCDKVEEIKYHFGYYDMGEWTESYILENSCLTAEELDNYLQASKEYDEKKISKVYGYAIHITKLEIFDKPKEISEFEKLGSFLNPTIKCPKKDKGWCNEGISPFTNQWCGCERAKLTRAPQSWCYIENI